MYNVVLVMELLYLLLIFWGTFRLLRDLFRDIAIQNSHLGYHQLSLCAIHGDYFLATPGEIYSTNLVGIRFHSSNSKLRCHSH
jgi:hypothetical protein